ncbi:Predicted CoA-binding protein [Malonomonas rubra DSM 5091]|uniref:Predicted CoA-binding protein n=1 Tax=Malonomonas rubra DSM 5091 TaxID=1122189 RepID=A0A1M6FLG0_MALRU|nr:CoA-binding protein [Malonomonas rubra]SHI98550.1 Predicted CoA-binding protein [Malonomonas rubra DSM 5091]
MSVKQQVDTFLTSPVIGVVGASSNPGKFGNKVLRCYLENNRKVVPVHPKEAEIEGLSCVASVAELPDEVKSISVITPPQVTEKVVEMAATKGIENVWMQPGAESPAAVEFCREKGINVIYGGTCVLVELGFGNH